MASLSKVTGIAWFRSLPKPLRKHVLFSTAITILAIALSMYCARSYSIPNINYDIPLQGNASIKIGMVTQYIDINVNDGRVVVDWFPLSFDDTLPGTLVDIYVDPNTLWPTDALATATADPPSVPIFKFNTSLPKYRTLKSSTMSFRTITTLTASPSWRDRQRKTNLQDYPWDVFTAQLHIFAVDNATGNSVGIVTSLVYGTPVNFNVKVNPLVSINDVEALWYQLDISRSAGVKLLVVVVILTYWLVSITFLCITVAAVMWPENVVKEIFAVPIAALFAFTSMRTSLPGAPEGFGARIDFVGILPNIVLLACSSIVTLFVVLIRRMRAHDLGPKNGDGGPRMSSEGSASSRDTQADMSGPGEGVGQ